MATGSSDKTIIVWNTTSCRPLRRLRGHRNLVLGLAFDSSGQRLLSAGYDNDCGCGIWHPVPPCGFSRATQPGSGRSSSATARPIPPPMTVLSAAGAWIVPASGFGIWMIRSRPLPLLPDPTDGTTGDLLIGFADGCVRGYRLPSSTTRSMGFNPAAVGAERQGDSNKTLPGGPHSGSDPDSVESAVRTTAHHDAEPTAVTDAGDTSVEFSPNTPGALRLNLSAAHAASVKRFTLAPERQTLATSGMDGIARVWRIQRDADGLSLEPLHHFKQHSDAVHAVNFSSDSRLLVIVGYDGRSGCSISRPVKESCPRQPTWRLNSHRTAAH